MIYANPNNITISEDAQLLTEGFTINRTPPREFYKTAQDIINGLSKAISLMNQRQTLKGWIKKQSLKSMNTSDVFNKSVELANKIVKINLKIIILY